MKWGGEVIRDLNWAPPRPRRHTAWRPLTVALILGLLIGYALGNARSARADGLDQHERHAFAPPFTSVEDVVRWHATLRGQRPEPLLTLAWCESRFDPGARGDDGGSHGIYQLNDRPTGLLRHFYAVDYDDPYDAEQAIEYVVRVAAGEFLPGQPGALPLHPYGVVSLARWSCWR